MSRRHPPVQRAATSILVALAVLLGTGALVGAQSPETPPAGACGLLTDEEILEATGAVGVTTTEPRSSLAAAGYGEGCTRQLEPSGGLSPGATLALDYGYHEPGGRSLYEGQLAVTPDVTHVAGLGDDAFEGLSGEWYAVKGDATLGLQHLGIGVFDTGLVRVDLASRALTWLIMSRLPGETGAPDATGPVCVMTAGELTDLVGAPFTAISPGELNCLYHGDPATGAYALDVRLEDPPMGSSDADLALASLGSGEATTVTGRPAWTSDEALWVDLGTRLLVVQPMFLAPEASAPIGEVMASVAELVAGRLAPDLADPSAAPTPMTDTDLAALFPTELKGAPVTVQTVTGQELAGQLGDPARLEPIEAVVSGLGRTIDDLSMGVADLFNANDRSGSIIAIRVQGADAATFGIPLLLALQGMQDLPIGRTPATIGGKDVMVLEVPGRDPAVPVHAWSHGDVAWFIQADTCIRYTPEQGCQEMALDRPLLEEILSKLP